MNSAIFDDIEMECQRQRSIIADAQEKLRILADALAVLRSGMPPVGDAPALRGANGGQARAKALSPEQRRKISQDGAAVRWGRPPIEWTGEMISKAVNFLSNGATQKQAAKGVGISQGTLARAIKNGTIPIQAVGGP